MKHTLNVTLLLVFMFLISQIVGLFFLANDITQVEFVEDQIVVVHQDTAVGERPDIAGSSSVIYISIIIFIGTLIFLILAKFKARKIWKGWYFVAIVLAITIALGVFIDPFIAFLIALAIGLLKVWKINSVIHNLSEILMYTGVAVIFVPLFDLFWIAIFLVIISVYDMYAVWKSKHMIIMAKFASEADLFAGLSLDYGTKCKPVKSAKAKKIQVKKAILGGGDVVFPLFFSGVVMEFLVKQGYTLVHSYLLTMIIVAFSGFSLFMLFYYSKKGKFYPAMPFLSAGCFTGLAFMWLITLLL